MIVTAHGIEFIREGTCQQCGACGCAKGPCPHYYEQDGKHWCAVYTDRESYCAECETDHASCITYPDNPWIHVVRRGVCAYRFKRADGGSMDELPFLNGESYQWLT